MRAQSPLAHQRRSGLCLPTLVGLATLTCAQVIGVPESSAQETQARVEVMTSTECANAPGQQLLLDELRVRLPQESAVRLGQASPSTSPAWTLRWSKLQPEDSCTLTLSDIEPVVQVPLDQGAEPAAIREAIVRIAWFISTTPARSNAPKVTTSPSAKLEPAPTPGELPDAQALLEQAQTPTQAPDKEPAPSSADKTPPEPIEAPDAKEEPEVQEPAPEQPSDSTKKAEPASAGGSKKSSTGITAQATGMADEVLATLQLWRNQTPNLFGSLDQKLQPLPSTVFGSPSSLGLHMGFSTDVTLLQLEPAWIGGVHVGMFITEHITAGLSYQGLMSDLTYVDSQDAPLVLESGLTEDRVRELSLHAMSLEAEYILFPDENVHLSLAASLGAGITSSRDLNTPRKRNATFLMTTLSGNLLYDVYPWMQAGFGFSWRDVSGNNLNAVGSETFSGPSGTFLLRIGMF